MFIPQGPAGHYARPSAKHLAGPTYYMSQLPDLTNRPSQVLGRLFLGTSTIMAPPGKSAASFDVWDLSFIFAP